MAVSAADPSRLRILHVLRAPLGGLFRHVLDLTREQIARGHAVGLITGLPMAGTPSEAALAELAPNLALGLTRVSMHRNPNLSDFAVLAHVMRRCRALKPDVVHGHGSKGGLFARAPRLIGDMRPLRTYTPHGGSFNYKPGTALHRVYMAAERLLAVGTDVFLFESRYIAERFASFVAPPRVPAFVVHNGIGPDECQPVQPVPDAADFLYVGELRAAKGIDTLLAALVMLGADGGPKPTAVLVGSGPDHAALSALVSRLGLDGHVRFTGPLPARTAFSLGRIMVVPSRAESLPYIVLEAAGAGMPLIATDVGGIPEIFGPMRDWLVRCDDPTLLAHAMRAARDRPAAEQTAMSAQLADYVAQSFSIDGMVDAVLAGYRAGLAARAGRPVQTGLLASS